VCSPGNSETPWKLIAWLEDFQYSDSKPCVCHCRAGRNAQMAPTEPLAKSPLSQWSSERSLPPLRHDKL